MADSQSIYPLDSSLPLSTAGPKWLAEHRCYLKPKTIIGYRTAVNLHSKFMGEIVLRDIRPAHIRAYQTWRAERAGPYLINSEVGVLQLILKHAGEWDRLKAFYKPLRVTARRPATRSHPRRRRACGKSPSPTEMALGRPLHDGHAFDYMRVRRTKATQTP